MLDQKAEEIQGGATGNPGTGLNGSQAEQRIAVANTTARTKVRPLSLGQFPGLTGKVRHTA